MNPPQGFRNNSDARRTRKQHIARFLTTAGIIFILVACSGTTGLRGKKPDTEKGLTVRGKLVHVMAIGGETTGWGIELDKPLDIEDRKVFLLEIEAKGMQLGEFENSQVEAWGLLKMRQGVERKFWPVLEVKVLKDIPSGRAPPKGSHAGRTGIRSPQVA